MATMRLFDVNVLIYAADRRSADHDRYHRWLSELVEGPEPFGAFDLVLSSFVRIATHPKIFTTPWKTTHAIDFVSRIRGASNCIVVRPGARHWDIFVDLCRRVGARSNVVPDAYLAALAIESGCEWITTDRGFARFPALRWRHPFDI
jgi:toxin-antitoxin system PIN domain toxin